MGTLIKMVGQIHRTKEETENDSPCIGTCKLNEDNICMGCNRHINEIIKKRGRTEGLNNQLENKLIETIQKK